MTDLPTLTTERLILRPFALSDARDVQRLAGDWAVANTTLNIPHPYEDGIAEEWISRHEQDMRSGEQVTLAITLRASDALVGAIGMRLTTRFARAEMGYWIGRPYWGHGYCTEAARAVLGFGFDALGLHKIFAAHLVRNPASGRVMQKIGMAHEGTLREHVQKWGAFEDIKMYGILRCEYDAN